MLGSEAISQPGQQQHGGGNARFPALAAFAAILDVASGSEGFHTATQQDRTHKDTTRRPRAIASLKSCEAMEQPSPPPATINSVATDTTMTSAKRSESSAAPEFVAWAQQHQRANRLHQAELAQITEHPDPTADRDAIAQQQAWARRHDHERQLHYSAIQQMRARQR
jgi:hypothetical protein